MGKQGLPWTKDTFAKYLRLIGKWKYEVNQDGIYLILSRSARYEVN